MNRRYFSAGISRGVWFVAGLVIGTVAAATMSKFASEYFVENLKFNYTLDQERKAKAAFAQGKLDEAIRYFENVVELTDNRGASVFHESQQQWTVFYPFLGAAINFFYATDPITKNVTEGTSRAKLAWVLEQRGNISGSEEEFQRSAQLMGYQDINKARLLGQESLKR